MNGIRELKKNKKVTKQRKEDTPSRNDGIKKVKVVGIAQTQITFTHQIGRKSNNGSQAGAVGVGSHSTTHRETHTRRCSHGGEERAK